MNIASKVRRNIGLGFLKIPLYICLKQRHSKNVIKVRVGVNKIK